MRSTTLFGACSVLFPILAIGCGAQRAVCPPCPTCVPPRAAAVAEVEAAPRAGAQPGPIAALSLAAARARRTNAKCGVERWDVKTLSDPDVTQVDFNTVVPTTVAELNALPPRCSGGLHDPRAGDPEHTVYEVIGVVTVVKSESDRDYHIAIGDPEHPDKTMVVEVVDPRCPGATTSPKHAALQRARTSFDNLLGGGDFESLVGVPVRVRGVGFYDKSHGQEGLSDSCIEFHPVLDINLAE